MLEEDILRDIKIKQSVSYCKLDVEMLVIFGNLINNLHNLHVKPSWANNIIFSSRSCQDLIKSKVTRKNTKE